MKILFVDESGDPGNPNIHPGATKYFIVGGIILTEITWRRLKNEISKLKKKYKIKANRELKLFYLFLPNKALEFR